MFSNFFGNRSRLYTALISVSCLRSPGPPMHLIQSGHCLSRGEAMAVPELRVGRSTHGSTEVLVWYTLYGTTFTADFKFFNRRVFAGGYFFQGFFQSEYKGVDGVKSLSDFGDVSLHFFHVTLYHFG